jgi:superfamily II DNA or RNA helicase
MSLIQNQHLDKYQAHADWENLESADLLAVGRVALFKDDGAGFERLRALMKKREDSLKADPDLRKAWNTLARFAAFQDHDLPGRNVSAQGWDELSLAVEVGQEWSRVTRPSPAKPREGTGSVYAVLLFDVEGDRRYSVYVGSTNLTVEGRVTKHLARQKAGRGLVYWYGVRGGGAEEYSGEMVLWDVFRNINPVPTSQLVMFEAWLADELRKAGITVYGGGQEFVGERVCFIRDAQALHTVISGSDDSWRHHRVPLPLDSLRGLADSPKLYAHQEAALKSLARGNANGIVCLPTGAGKTRVAVEHIAAVLRRDGEHHRFLWVSYPTVVLKQGMAALLEWRDLLPVELHFRWSAEGDAGDADLLADASITFLLRDSFAKSLNGGVMSPISLWLDADPRNRVTVILDEVHALLSPMVVKGLATLFAGGAGTRTRKDRVRLVGLSATPVPSNAPAIAAAQRYFPADATTKRPDWNLQVFEFQDANAMVRSQVTCPADRAMDILGVLRVPRSVLALAVAAKTASGWSQSMEEEENTNKRGKNFEMPGECEVYARRLISHPKVSQYLAARVAELQIPLGKTIIFAASIDAANDIYRELRERDVSAFLVHSKLSEMTPYQSDRRMNISRQIAAFKANGSKPCVMVNVGILTTGFDDPAIQSVVLGRPVSSLNLFWQMVGRGLRGPRAGGTTSCNVLDVVDLQQLFELNDGYRPEAFQLARFGAQGWFAASQKAAAPGSESVVQSAPVAPSLLADVLLDRKRWGDLMRLRELLLSLDRQQLPDKSVALRALQDIGVKPSAMVLSAPDSGNQSTFWTVRLVTLARERKDDRFLELLRELPTPDEGAKQYAFHERIERLLASPAAGSGPKVAAGRVAEPRIAAVLLGVADPSSARVVGKCSLYTTKAAAVAAKPRRAPAPWEFPSPLSVKDAERWCETALVAVLASGGTAAEWLQEVHGLSVEDKREEGAFWFYDRKVGEPGADTPSIRAVEKELEACGFVVKPVPRKKQGFGFYFVKDSKNPTG